jgi:hypothetical protein
MLKFWTVAMLEDVQYLLVGFISHKLLKFLSTVKFLSLANIFPNYRAFWDELICHESSAF